MRIERKKNAVRGTFFGIVFRLIQIIFPLIIRTIFIYTLGVEYLGLNSLFTAILQVLNLAELGVSSALVFSMYRPIVVNDTKKMCQLLNLYKLYYRLIGFVVLLIGLFLVPFLPHLISGTIPDDINIYILYAMNLASTVLSYWLFAYRNSLFAAHQRNDIVSIISIFVNSCMYGMQIVSLLAFGNYYLYLSLTIVGQISINIITAIVSKRFYPDYTPSGKLPLDERKDINKKVRDLFTAKVGSVINNSADSIVISAILGLEVLAIYQNYYYIISAIMAMFAIFFNACTAGIGNSLIVNDSTQNRRLLYNINHIVFFAINFGCTCFVCMCQPFMRIWVGEKYALDFPFVILFALYLFAEEAPRTLIVFKDAGGIWKHDRYRPLISAGVNLSLNIALTPIIGLYGIIISTLIAMLFVSFPWAIMNINKRLFAINIRKYLSRLALYIVAICVSSLLAYFICSNIHITSMKITLIIRGIIASIISPVVFLLFFCKSEETSYLLHSVKEIIRRLHKSTTIGTDNNK